MMITIHGLPPKTTFQAVKTLVKQECNIVDFILDNLVDDGPNAKKVRIGVSDDSEGYRIIKYLNGFRMSPTHLLKIVPVGKPLNPPPEQSYNQRPTYLNEPQNDYQSQPQPRLGYQVPVDNYGSTPSDDTRKGNYPSPQIMKKNIERKQDHLNAGPLRAPDPRPSNLEHRPGLHGSGTHGPSSHGPSSHLSGTHGPSSQMPGSRSSNMHVPESHGHGPYGSGPHSLGAQFSGSHGPSSHMSGPDVRNSSQWGQDVNSGRMGESEWGQPSQGMQGPSSYSQRPSQGGFGQQQVQGATDPYSAPQGRGPPPQGFGFHPKPAAVQEMMAAPPQQRDTRQHVLRAVDIVDTPPVRQYPQEKPITIMKENFQGPQYSSAPQQSNYPGQAPGPVWQMNQQPKPQYDNRHPPMDKRVDPAKQDFEQKRGQFIPIGSSRPISPTNRGYQEQNRQYPERRLSPSRPGPSVREFSPSLRRSPGRKMSPGRKASPARRFSPGRKMSPSHRRMSPGRRYSPGSKRSPLRFSPRRKMSPGRYSPGRKMSPGRYSPERSGQGHQMSPDGDTNNAWSKGWNPELDHLKKKSRQLFNRATNTNRIEDWENFKHAQRLYKKELANLKRKTMKEYIGKEGRTEHEVEIDDRGERGNPDDRRMGGRYASGRQSPTRRLVSPPRPRFSPNRLGDKPSNKFLDEGAVPKPVRPAYEPTQAQNQYTGYRDSAQYPRQDSRPSPWQNEKIIFPSSAKEEDRRDMRRLDKPVEKSPRLSRSPIKDRYRRHSPSPRSRSSRSPRRSWALEKRSPEVIREPPPPPVWPGQEPDPPRKPTRFNSPTQEPKHGTVWRRLDEPRQFQEKTHARSDMDEPRPFQDKLRVRNDMQDKFRRDPDDRRDFREEERKQTDRDREYRREDRPEYRRESPRREDRDPKKVFTDIDKDFQDIYERAVQFRKKTEERQRSGDRQKADERYRAEPAQRRSRSREHKEWTTKDRKRIFLSPTIKAKRDKAADDIVERIFSKYDLTEDQKLRIKEELKMTLATIFIEMFADKDVSFIELVIKYQAKYPPKEEEKLLQEVLTNLPSQYRNLKRKAETGDASVTPAKTSRRSPQHTTKEERRPASHHIARERERRPIASRTLKRVASPSFKHSIGDFKRPLMSRSGRDVELTRRPVYGKRPAEGEKTVKRVLRKPEGSKVVKSLPKAACEGKPDAPNTEPSLEGHYELSPLLNKMLEAELQDIIEKVRELEPVNPKDETENLVVERFRNRAGDALINTIGLNVTKRLLNIHNPLYVKMVFSGKPLRKDLVAFLKQYNICAFKRVGDRGGIFAAKMRTYQDFDDLCTNDNLKCGKISVTVSPCYQFTTRPANLKTPFDPKETKKTSQTTKKDVQKETKPSVKNTNVPQNTDKSQEEIQKVSPNQPKETAVKTIAPNTQTNIITKNVTSTKATDNNIEAAKNNTKVTAIAVTNKPETKGTGDKTQVTAPPKVIPAKVAAIKQNESPKPTENKPTNTPENKPALAKVQTGTKSEPKVTPAVTKPQASNQNVTKVTTELPAGTQTKTPTEKATTAKVPPKATQVAQKVADKNATMTKTNQAQTAVTNSAKTPTQNKPNTPMAALKQNVAANRTVTNKPKVTSTPSKQTAAHKSRVTPKKKENDLDELNDHDILALLSEGIVLDECSGSDGD